jgi:signal transduction histidine kinase
VNRPVMDQIETTSSEYQHKRTLKENLSAILKRNSFTPNFLPSYLRYRAIGYLLAFLLPFLMYGTLQFVPGLRYVESSLILAIILISLGWGLLPGLVALFTGIALLVATFPPGTSILLENIEDIFSAILFTIICLSLSLLTSRVQRERFAASQAQREAEEANKMMDDFIGVAAHELRTPLATAKVSIQLSQRMLKQNVEGLQSQVSQAKMEQNLQSLQKNLERAKRQLDLQNRLVQDLLDASRIQANRLELRMKQCDLLEIVRDCVEAQHSLNPERSLVLHASIPGEVLVEVDVDRVAQVITNYLTNALKYSQVDKPVVVEVVREVAHVRVAVHDQGPGLTAEQQEHIWERLYRVPGVHVYSGSGIGLGLGLYICHTLIERMNGQVGLESTPGQGSTFWFKLPLAQH